MRSDPLTRFWRHVDRSGTCWIWKGALCGDYGLFKDQGKTHRAHRWLCIHLRGPISPGLVVRHKCNRPACVNPDHLELATHQDNAQDRVRAGRWKQRIPRGEKHGLAKLTDLQVRAIRRLALSGHFSQTYLAE